MHRAGALLFCRLHPITVGLDLPVNRAQRSVDGRTQGLVAGVNHDRDCGQNQRILSHGLPTRELITLHIQLSQNIHCSLYLRTYYFLPDLSAVLLIETESSTRPRPSSNPLCASIYTTCIKIIPND